MDPQPGFFDKLMQKPESYRKKLAFGLTAVLGIFVFAGWLLVTSQTLQQSAAPATNPKDTAAEEIKKNLPSLQEQTLKTQLMKEQEQAAGQESDGQEKKPAVIER